MPHTGNFFFPEKWFEDTPSDNEIEKGPTSNWAFDHKAAPNDHHTKYTDAEARAVHSPMSIPAPAFVPGRDTHDWSIDCLTVRNYTALTMQYFHALVILPDGVTVAKVTLYGFRNDELATLELSLRRGDRAGNFVPMVTVTADWTTGYSSGYSDTIDYATIDNANYIYGFRLGLDPNDDVNDVRFTGAKIEFSG